MKRASMIGGMVLVIVVLLAACSPSPKSQVSDFVGYFPDEIGVWELDERATVALEDSTVTTEGHSTMTYEGPDDSLAFIVVEAYASVDAAEVAYARRERELLLSGLTLEADRQGGQATAHIAQTERVRYALFLESTIMVEVDTLSAEGEPPVSDESFDELLSLVRAVYKKVMSK